MNRDKTGSEYPTAKTAALVSCRNLTKTYVRGQETISALKNVTLDIAGGDFVAVVGPSGSGKSTFVHVAGCLEKPTQGQVFIDGRDTSGLSPDQLAHVRNRTIGFVFQQFHLLSRCSAQENVELPLVYSGMAAPARAERARFWLEQMGLGKRHNHRPAELSGGEQQRVAIARAMANQPKIVFADEPTGALDYQTGMKILELFQKLNGAGTAIVLVTHERHVSQFAKRSAEFRDGALLG
ncbi:MAG TPA: ABC transporter ATP-binding protein [Sphingomonadales bacterium]|nr:ABC transporter ATP-binding protein [Sphingomonadales bacterium]